MRLSEPLRAVSPGAFGPGAVESEASRRRYLARARDYSAVLVAMIYLQDIFWLVLSRGSASFYSPPYLISAWNWPLFLLFVCHAVFLSAIGFAATRLMKPMREISIRKRSVILLILVSCIGNVLIFLVLAPGARYTTGGLTGLPGLIYGVFRGLALGIMFLLVRLSALKIAIPKGLIALFTVSFVLTVDGFAPGLILFVFLALMVPVRFDFSHLAFRWPLVILAGALIAYTALRAKWTDYAPDMNFGYLASWLIPRFSIQAESMFSFISGDLGIKDSGDGFDLIARAVRNRFYLVSGQDYLIEYPRSVSEALYLDLFGSLGSGSSPGALLGTAMFGPFCWIVPFFLAFLFVQLFYHWRTRLTLLKAVGLTLLLKPIYTDPSEYFTVISPTLVYIALFFLGCVLVPREPQAARGRKRPGRRFRGAMKPMGYDASRARPL